MHGMTQLYLLQITAFALTQTGAVILGNMLFTPVSARRLTTGISCIALAAAIFYETVPG